MGHTVIVEDDEDSARMISTLIGREGHSVATAGSIQAARRLLAMQSPDLLLLDLHLPDGSGFELLRDVELLSDVEVVLMTGQASVETSVQALRMGAADYLVKPVSPVHLRGLLSRLIRPSRLREELAQITEQWRETGRFGDLIGESETMQRVYRQISRVAGTAVTVFIHGESGTGKELVARAVHDMSRRREQPFLAVNCGALSPHLIESEIFGHEKGSFTGAERQHQGFFERAHGGTLFLDEVTEMPLELQVKLLRVLETGTFMRVGSTQLQQTDVRIIAATNRDAARAVERGTLREDLLYRLNVFPIGLPPLRERGTDVQLIARSFLQDMGAQERQEKHFTEGALARLLDYGWPGNVRELRNVVQRAWVMASGKAIDEEWLPVQARPAGAAVEEVAASSLRRLPDADAGVLNIPVGVPLADVERQVILATFAHCGQHKERTAAMLGISMKTLYNRLKDYRS
ncbi:sigma-54 dependent transcriptional regulator [Variovorax sp. UMC13]|uniref:sigma-54-dependent transcriptional regulator n=1 Tax=Variovorax sp. UMC13 TaxID=1862326 RepID=UPI0015FF4232|nr:sigma-54 dependent transcriptional regulator [Variovorax sp. UMC13]MBB1600462.1 sigma-54-dependent Fis family transcriptional regulator [Variovorax sp. UMC13]